MLSFLRVGLVTVSLHSNTTVTKTAPQGAAGTTPRIHLPEKGMGWFLVTLCDVTREVTKVTHTYMAAAKVKSAPLFVDSPFPTS